MRPPIWIALPWTAAAFLATICGIGGGLFAVPLLHYAGRLPLRPAVGTSLCLVFVLATTATVAEAARPDSALSLPVASLLVLGCLPGAQIGFRVSQRISAGNLKKVFVGVLLLAGLRVLLVQSAAGGAGEGLTGAELALIPAVGFLGGFVAPILGIGGGLVVVPMLFLFFPGLDYLDARANSLAMSVFASAWSVRQYLRSGELRPRAIAPLIASTAVGAVVGVLTVHREGWSEIARLAMGGILVLVALRFALDVWRGRTARG